MNVLYDWGGDLAKWAEKLIQVRETQGDNVFILLNNHHAEERSQP